MIRNTREHDLRNGPADLPAAMSPRKWEITCSIAKAFAARGYHAVGMRDLAGELGLNPGTLYHHFPSKDEALLAICLVGQAEVSANLDDALAHHAAFAPRIRALFAAHQASLHRIGDFIDVYTSRWQDLPQDLAAPLREGWRAQRSCFDALFEDALARGEIASDIPVKDGIRLLMGIFRTVNVLHRTGRKEDIPGFVEHAVTVILRGMGA